MMRDGLADTVRPRYSRTNLAFVTEFRLETMTLGVPGRRPHQLREGSIFVMRPKCRIPLGLNETSVLNFSLIPWLLPSSWPLPSFGPSMHRTLNVENFQNEEVLCDKKSEPPKAQSANSKLETHIDFKTQVHKAKGPPRKA